MTRACDNQPGIIISDAERHAIEVHKYYLSEAAGYDIGEELATEHWLGHHAAQWRREQLRRDLAAQQREIAKHKWIESERAGYDLGDEAVLDWIRRYAASWRRSRGRR